MKHCPVVELPQPPTTATAAVHDPRTDALHDSRVCRHVTPQRMLDRVCAPKISFVG